MAGKDRSWMDQPAQAKIGAGHFQAWLRQGFKEVAQVLPAFNQGQHIVEEPGLFGNLTPGEIAKGKEQEMQLDGNQEPAKQMEHGGREM
jgi:hypothetical protein